MQTLDGYSAAISGIAAYGTAGTDTGERFQPVLLLQAGAFLQRTAMLFRMLIYA